MDPEAQRRDTQRAGPPSGEWDDLPPRNEFWILEEAEARLRKDFPNLLERLKTVTADGRYNNFFTVNAAEHSITTEALVEILEQNASSILPETELALKFEKRLIEKVVAFSMRPIEEQKLIRRVFPFVDPFLLGRAYQAALIRAQDVVWSLQQPSVYYDEVLPKLGVPEVAPGKGHRK